MSLAAHPSAATRTMHVGGIPESSRSSMVCLIATVFPTRLGPRKMYKPPGTSPSSTPDLNDRPERQTVGARQGGRDRGHSILDLATMDLRGTILARVGRFSSSRESEYLICWYCNQECMPSWLYDTQEGIHSCACGATWASQDNRDEPMHLVYQEDNLDQAIQTLRSGRVGWSGRVNETEQRPR